MDAGWLFELAPEESDWESECNSDCAGAGAGAAAEGGGALETCGAALKVALAADVEGCKPWSKRLPSSPIEALASSNGASVQIAVPSVTHSRKRSSIPLRREEKIHESPRRLPSSWLQQMESCGSGVLQ